MTFGSVKLIYFPTNLVVPSRCASMSPLRAPWRYDTFTAPKYASGNLNYVFSARDIGLTGMTASVYSYFKLTH